MADYRIESPTNIEVFAKRVRSEVPDATTDEIWHWYGKTGYKSLNTHVANTWKSLKYHRRKKARATSE